MLLFCNLLLLGCSAAGPIRPTLGQKRSIWQNDRNADQRYFQLTRGMDEAGKIEHHWMDDSDYELMGDPPVAEAWRRAP